ncbi:ABC transporter, permease protein [Winogradskyella psychrotolerans RS-3]|uniref:ABC transporter, permease protein n=1 Tax=Winogradskyella psychrotolerans RS-3 TaxID=641526 RepID=S7VV23_9FLAO|nr:ABC transporter permease [Winogradskyella psychrotolerans]EPR73926.1 ABC transporter, permease protein [Winogradskyella psychrotolerans RS-3]
MIRSYIKIAWRSLKTNRLFSIVNILGLSIGLATTLVLFLFILHERSFDSMYANKDKIYRVLLNTTEDDLETWTGSPSAVALELEANIPDIAEAGRLLKHDFGGTAFIKASNEVFTEKKLFWSDASVLDMFDVEIVKGEGSEVLKTPNTVLLSESTAKRYFGNENPIGKTLTIDDVDVVEVRGIFKDFPENSSLDFNVVAPFLMQNAAKNPTWDNASFETFLRFNSASPNVANVEAKIQDILDKNVKKDDQWYNFSLQPLEEIHLYSSTYKDSYIERNGDINQIRNLTALAILILIIACINYMNLITARSQKRATDVGINKTLGASVRDIIVRFYIETGLITAIAMILGGVLAVVALPVFNDIAGKELDISSLFSIEIIIFLVLIWFVTSLISGSYPALYLSRFSPKEVLKPSTNKGGVASVIRKGLVVVQFSASVVLIIGVIVIHQQLEYIQNKSLGYNPENVMAISTSAIRGGQANQALVNAFKKLPNVSVVGRSQGYPGMGVSGRSINKPNTDETMGISTNTSEREVADVLQLKLLAGQLLPKNKQAGDTLVEVVVNKTTVDFLGLSPEEAIGKKVAMQLGNNAYIHGVVEDFNFASLHNPIGAYAFHNSNREPKSYLLIRFTNEVLSETISNFENTFKNIAPNSAFEYTFLDKNLELLYEKEQRTANVGLLFSILAVIVACLGLFGLAAYMAEQRHKEIGIRKVFGASVPRIVQLLSMDFMRLVLISLVISFPLAFYFMNQWLQDFAYRVTISWTVFAIAGALALMITFVTVGYQAVKAAVANPIKSLRTE